jgi:hypothetical protein
MEEVKKALREMGSYLYYGELKANAEKYGVDYHRAKDIMRGKLKPTEADMYFVNAIYDMTLPRMQSLEKVKIFAR